MQYADDLITKLCKVAEVYQKSALNEIFIIWTDSSVCHSCKEYYASSPLAGQTSTAFKEQMLLKI